MGPRGIVSSNVSLLKPYCTDLSQFHGYLRLDSRTTRSNEEIEQFIKEWVSTHPRYNAWGPNCQLLHRIFTFSSLVFRCHLPVSQIAIILMVERP